MFVDRLALVVVLGMGEAIWARDGLGGFIGLESKVTLLVI
jgi:hypothetical protein